MNRERAFSGGLAFLSNFYPCGVKGPLGFIYPSVEHAYQISKCSDVYHMKTNDWFKFCNLTPSQAKKIGGKFELPPDWETTKLKVMEDLLRSKFAIPELREKLKNTGDMELVETNWWGDTFWGVCNGKGENHLGKLLMKIRSEINIVDNSGSV